MWPLKSEVSDVGTAGSTSTCTDRVTRLCSYRHGGSAKSIYSGAHPRSLPASKRLDHPRGIDLAVRIKPETTSTLGGADDLPCESTVQRNITPVTHRKQQSTHHYTTEAHRTPQKENVKSAYVRVCKYVCLYAYRVYLYTR